MFVRLQDLHIEGLVHITSLGRDFYHFDDVRMCLTGESSGKKYRVGDEIHVQVAAVNLDEKKIDLRLEGHESKESLKGKSKSKSKMTKRSKTNSDKNEGKSSNQSQRKPKSSTKDKPKEKSKAKKRSARKKRPGKNARKNAQNK
jgi:ribonuclease R